MALSTLEKILTHLLDKYMNMEYELLPNVLGYEIKQEVGRVNNMICQIYSSEHNPPHFHVIKKDNSVNAKFFIKDGKFMSGKIGTKDIKRIEAWFDDWKTKEILKLVWEKLKIPE